LLLVVRPGALLFLVRPRRNGFHKALRVAEVAKHFENMLGAPKEAL